jgi:superfamily II DNA or RNA helicase
VTSLRTFERRLNQNATDPAAVSGHVARAQLETAAALRERLDSFGGAMLGDEVGAGKTFTTFALLAEALAREPNKGAVIFVPSELLKWKWERQLNDYLDASVRDRVLGARLARRVMTMDRSLRGPEGRRPKSNSIVITTHSVFAYRTSDYDRGVCLAAWLEKRCSSQRKPRSRLFRACGLTPEYDHEPWARWASREILPSAALKPIDEVWTRWQDGDRDLAGVLGQSVQEVRREAGRRLLPRAALVVIDEAHNLRSTSSQVYGSLMHVLSARFDALLFLTATPFQLGRGELRNIVDFFRHANTYKDREEEFDRRVAAMENGMTAYVEALDQFGAAWRLLEPEETELTRVFASGRQKLNGHATRPEQAAERFRRCLEARERLQEGLRPFLVRSVRVRHHREHCGLERELEVLAPESRIPLALVDRIITELLSDRRRTFIASALTSACSSWEALFEAAITGDHGLSAAHTRDLLVEMRKKKVLGQHPKVAQTVRVCIEGVEQGEKTLVFVERAETGKAIRDKVKDNLGERYDRNARDRLQDPSRFGWPSLRENYLHTLYPDVLGDLPRVKDCLTLLREPYGRELWACVDVEGSSRNYKIEKRFLEHVVFRAAARGRWRNSAASPETVECAERILDPNYVMNGLDMVTGESGHTTAVPSAPRREQDRGFNEAFMRAYLRYRSPWASSVEQLRQLSPDERAEIVDAAASAIASSHLQVDIAKIEAVGDPAKHFRQMDRLLCAERSAWQARFDAIARQAADFAAVESTDAATDRVHQLATAFRSNERVQFISGDTKGPTRAVAVDGFNTPLYPEVIVATPVLAEGLDLHRQCRRVVHHDLPWNPAKLEQRTGRVDRIGSLSERLARDDGTGDTSIQVWLPFMPGTYDETIFERVMARRREFRCVLGNRPEWEGEDLPEDERGPAIDESLVEAIQVDLSPH